MSYGLGYDVSDIADSYYGRQEVALRKRPVCDCCEEHIQEDKYYDFNTGEIFCKACAIKFIKDNAEEFCRDYEMDIDID